MPTNEQKEEIRWATTTIGDRQKRYRIYRDYYAGVHRLMIDSERLLRTFKGLFRDFRLNLCSPVVDSLADRLEVQSFSAGEEEAEDALEIWKRNRMRRRAGHVHLEAISSGDAFAIVWPNKENKATIYPNKSTEVICDYDAENPGLVTRAAKLWKERDGSHRLTLYYPDRIEKYSTPPKGAGLQVGSALGIQNFSERPVEGEPWPLPNPYGQVPVFHFANNADLGEAGVSELRDAVPVQDALNKSVLDMLVLGEYQAYPQRYALNIQVNYDSEGNPINPFKAGPERMWIVDGGEDTQIGQYAAADLDPVLRVKQAWALDMAQVTQTPPHYFMMTANMVSGESQKTAEQKLDAKVSDRQHSFGDAWADLMALAVRMERGMATDGLELDTNWADLKPRNEKESWEIAGLKSGLGVSREQILREMGYEEDQIEQFAQENQQAQEATQIPPDTLARTQAIFERVAGNGRPNQSQAARRFAVGAGDLRDVTGR